LREVTFSQELLNWYEVHARDLPWRILPRARADGVRADPYRIWLSEVMLQQTTVAAVAGYFAKFTTTWPTISALAAADDADVMAAWAGLGYYARARNLLKCARRIVSDFGGEFPSTREELLTLPGIGPYTAAAIAAIAFEAPETVVDGNVERVMARVFAVETPLPDAKPELVSLAQSLTPTNRAGDYAQSVMDLGATICTPKSPACGICPVRQRCKAQAQGLQAELPRKRAKPAKPTRLGMAYMVQRADGAWLLETRPERGLLGGMLGWPGADWADVAQQSPPLDADWHSVAGEVRHTFTHFHLRLSLQVARVSMDAKPTTGRFLGNDAFRPSDLPTVMRKAFDLARGHALFD